MLFLKERAEQLASTCLMKVHILWLGTVLGLVLPPVQADSLNPAGSFQFRMPQRVTFRPEERRALPGLSPGKVEWLKAFPENGSTNAVELGSRVVVQLRPAADLPQLIAGRLLELARVVTTNLFILQAP